MAIKRHHPENRQFQRLMVSLNRSYDEIVAGAGMQEGYMSLKRVGENLHIKAYVDGKMKMGSVPYSELEKIRGHVGKTCLFCSNGLRIIFEPSPPKKVFCLVCPGCNRFFRVEEGDLCLSDI